MPESNVPAQARTPQITVQDKSKLSELQEQFNLRVRQVEKLKQAIAARRQSIAQAQKRVEKELRPIVAQVTEKRVALVKLLDESYAQPFLRKREKKKLAHLISKIAFDLIQQHGRQDMLALHDKYAERPFEEQMARAVKDADKLASEIFEVFREGEGSAEPADDFEDIHTQLDREMEQREREKQLRQKKRKTKAQLAKEAQAKAELQNISKASRRVYTELAKQLHPDVEQDKTARLWKEEAMKKVTQAYHNDDFFELLRLQLEFMQERQGLALDKLPEDQLRYYVKILTDQAQELKQELDHFFHSPEASFYEQFCGTPKQMDQKFKNAKESLSFELQQLQQNLRTLQDPQQIRQLLKDV